MRLALALVLIASSLPALAQSPDCPDGLLLELAPTYHEVVADDIAARAHLDAYLCALRPEALSSTADLLRVLSLRDSVIEHVSPVLDEWHATTETPDWQVTFEALFSEAESIALQPVQAEGMVFGLTYGPFPSGVQTAFAPDDLSLAIDLLEAEGRTIGGEYPFSDLEAEVDLVLLGENLRSRYPASPYLFWSQEAFGQALLTLASLHPVDDASGLDTWYAGVATAEFYPWAGDREALQHFVGIGASSRYHAPLAAILANPPVAVLEGDLDVLLASRADSREEAEARTLSWLDEGIDVVGPLWLGEDDWGVAYRYFPAGDARLEAAEAQAEAQGLVVERVRHSISSAY